MGGVPTYVAFFYLGGGRYTLERDERKGHGGAPPDLVRARRGCEPAAHDAVRNLAWEVYPHIMSVVQINLEGAHALALHSDVVAERRGFLVKITMHAIYGGKVLLQTRGFDLPLVCEPPHIC